MTDPTGSAVHLIQVALTPVFLLSGIGILLGLFNTRLARVADEMAHAADLLAGEVSAADHGNLRRHLARLEHRRWLLDASIVMGATGGASSCGAAFVLFLGSVGKSAVAGWLIGLFAVALGCAVMALIVFLGDSVLAWRGLRREGLLPRSIKSVR